MYTFVKNRADAREHLANTPNTNPRWRATKIWKIHINRCTRALSRVLRLCHFCRTPFVRPEFILAMHEQLPKYTDHPGTAGSIHKNVVLILYPNP